MKKQSSTSSIILKVYITIFFLYLFMPLAIMVAAAFNNYPQPSVTQWDGFTLRWFSELFTDPNNHRFISGLWNSLIIAAGVIIISVPLGLSGAFVLTRTDGRYRGFLYAVLVSPVLMPGIILGISSLIFWRNASVSAGLFVTMVAQSTYIASYCMLMFMARLQRQDLVLEEAALDLGATPLQAFRTITLPFLLPTIISASVLAFLQSIENYNTTVFAIGSQHTLVTEIGARMRFGLSPVINVIGVIFVVITIVSAVSYAYYKRKNDKGISAG